ncbi:hypothetical protein NQ318_010560, partial [Aromia moschata]
INVIILVFSEDLRDLNVSQLFQLANDVSHIRLGDIKDDDIRYFLFTKPSTPPIMIENDTIGDIDVNKSTKIIIHGWIANNRMVWNERMTEEFVKNDYNVIQVDWERLARAAYISSAVDTKVIGNNIGQFILDAELKANKVHLIGHSLGAHVAGFAAKKIKEATGEKVARISGLDPAGPYFRMYAFIKEERLDKEDAQVVDIIHTDGGTYGIEFPIGTLDIFVNGGRAPQPGCVGNFNVMSLGDLIQHSYCSHEMSVTYFIEWIGGGKFHCRLCNSWQNLVMGNCDKYLLIGEEDVNKEMTGTCFAKTRYRSPFLRN